MPPRPTSPRLAVRRQQQAQQPQQLHLPPLAEPPSSVSWPSQSTPDSQPQQQAAPEAPAPTAQQGQHAQQHGSAAAAAMTAAGSGGAAAGQASGVPQHEHNTRQRAREAHRKVCGAPDALRCAHAIAAAWQPTRSVDDGVWHRRVIVAGCGGMAWHAAPRHTPHPTTALPCLCPLLLLPQVRFAPGPWADRFRTHDGHPDHEGQLARQRRSMGAGWGRDLTPSAVRAVEAELGEACRPSIDRLKRRCGLAVMRMGLQAGCHGDAIGCARFVAGRGHYVDEQPAHDTRSVSLSRVSPWPIRSLHSSAPAAPAPRLQGGPAAAAQAAARVLHPDQWRAPG